jgi:arsenite methyltransferase
MSGQDRAWVSWLQQTIHDGGNGGRAYLPPYARIAERVLAQARIQPGDAVLEVGTGTRLLAFHALKYVGATGIVIGCDIAGACVEACRLEAEGRGERRVSFIESDAAALRFKDRAFDAVVMRSTLCHLHRKRDVVRHLYRVLKPAGRFSLYEPSDRHNTRYHQLVDIAALGRLGEKVRLADDTSIGSVGV